MFIEANFSAKGTDSPLCAAKPLTFCRSHAVCGGGGTDPGNVAGAALQRWHGVFCGVLQCDDGAGRSTGGDGWGTEAKSFSESPKIPKLLDRGDGRAYYFGRRTAEKRHFIEQKVSFT